MSEPSTAFLRHFREALGVDGAIRFDRFVDLALYHPEVGYYRGRRMRVGRGPSTDFYTSSTSGPVFGELVAAACADLLGGTSPSTFEFVEIGAEIDGGILAGIDHPFRSARTVGAGDRIQLTGQCIVFSNELLDAQPFRRFVRRNAAWMEIGVGLRGTELQEIEMAGAVDLPGLPADAPEGTYFDAPVGSISLVRDIASQDWSGLFVAFDYGSSGSAIVEAYPGGTARAYRRHSQVPNLLDAPGDQDLTCDVCWDWIASALQENGFQVEPLESQEQFLVRHAQRQLAAISHEEAGRLSRRKLAMQQLIQPGHLGQRFQVLCGRRPST
jgi:SAM-dependent MidA family methyltransferase